MALNHNIAIERKKLKLTQEQLAEKCSVSRQAVTKWESGESEPSIAKLKVLSKVFDISIDELITGRKHKCVVNGDYENKITGHIKLLTMMAHDLTSDYMPMYDESWRLIMLEELYDVIKMSYVDCDGDIRQQYLIDNTSTDERAKIVKLLTTNRAFAKDLFQDYIDGKKEITDIFSMLIERIKEQQAIASKNIDKKQDSTVAQLYYSIHRLVQSMGSFAEYSDSKLQQIVQELQDIIDGLDRNTYIGRFIAFYMENVRAAWNDKCINRLEELNTDWVNLQSYVWSKIEI